MENSLTQKELTNNINETRKNPQLIRHANIIRTKLIKTKINIDWTKGNLDDDFVVLVVVFTGAGVVVEFVALEAISSKLNKVPEH